MGWIEYILAMVAFFASHSVPLKPRVRPRIESLIGKRGFSIAYSSLSLAVLVWLIIAAGRAPYVELWPWSPWQNGVTLIAMLLACLILSASIARPNPFSFGGGKKPFNSEQPGLVRWIRHPLLVALALWALSHALPNGNLAHVILFGLFGGFALLGQKAIDRRKRRIMGQEWHDLLASSRAGNSAAFTARDLGIRLLAGFGLYLALLLMHPHIIGVSPLL